jgi:hypothetical protein
MHIAQSPQSTITVHVGAHLVGPANCTHLNAPPGCRASSPEKGPQEHGAVLLSSDTRSWQDEQVSQGQPAETTKVQSPLTHQTEERPPPSAPQTLAGSSCTAISILSTTMDTRTSCMRMRNVEQRGPGLTSTSSSGSMMSNVQVRWRQSKSLHFFDFCFGSFLIRIVLVLQSSKGTHGGSLLVLPLVAGSYHWYK